MKEGRAFNRASLLAVEKTILLLVLFDDYFLDLRLSVVTSNLNDVATGRSYGQFMGRYLMIQRLPRYGVDRDVAYPFAVDADCCPIDGNRRLVYQLIG